MTLQEQVLQALTQARGDDLSGEALARQLSVSRAAVWKAIEALRAAGYPITAGTRRGYRLEGGEAPLSAPALAAALGEAEERFHVYPALVSTNETAKRMALEGAPAGTAVLAEMQTGGRGRNGRSFYSPRGCGLYMSLLLRPDGVTAADSLLVTTAACVAVCRAVETVTGRDAEIKWVNDIYRAGKKVCGILTEAVTDLESGRVACLILGVGVNFRAPGQPLPPEVRDVAGYLYESDPPVTRNSLAAEIIRQAGQLEVWVKTGDHLEEYRARSLLTGKRVLLQHGGQARTAVVTGIDGRGGLMVRFPDGSAETMTGGDVSVRLAPQDSPG